MYIDLREEGSRAPTTSLAKACEKQYAIETYRRIRISKPERFREFGESLIRDLGEGYASRTWVGAERIDDPEELVEAQLLDEERNRASELVGSMVTSNTRAVKSSNKSSRWLSFGKNKWIFCASISPTNSEEMDRWRKTIPDEYDHISYIHRPREFARALGSMVAEQVGPQGKEAELKHSYEGELKLKTLHKCQLVVHGPVVYVEDPYTKISNAHDNWDYLARTAFVKDIEYQGQREYRFVVWTEEDPSDMTLDLAVSMGMLGAMEKRSGESAKRSVPTIIWSNDSSDSGEVVAGQEYNSVPDDQLEGTGILPRVLSRLPPFPSLRHDSVPITPSVYDETNFPKDWEKVATMYGAVQALRSLVGGPFGRRDSETASSAWHIEPCIRHLCEVFEDPIESIGITEDNFVVVTLNLNGETKSEGKIAVGPRGTGNYHIRRDMIVNASVRRDAWLLGESVEEHLKRAGVAVRHEPTVIARLRNQVKAVGRRVSALLPLQK